MIQYPTLTYIEKEQIVPEIDDPITLDRIYIPIIKWNGQKLEVRDAISTYLSLIDDSDDSDDSDDNKKLKLSFQNIINSIQKHAAHSIKGIKREE